MIDCIKGIEEEEEEQNDGSTPKKNTNTLEEVLVPMKQLVRHVVIVMDALKGFSLKPLQWALHHVISTHSTITLLGVMPWTPLACNPSHPSFTCFFVHFGRFTFEKKFLEAYDIY